MKSLPDATSGLGPDSEGERGRGRPRLSVMAER
jgi:hypothetical protein